MVKLKFFCGASAFSNEFYNATIVPFTTEFFCDETGATEEDNKDDNGLEDGLTKDVLNHSL